MGFYVSVKRKFVALRTFSWHEKWVLFQAWLLLLLVDLSLRVLPFKWVQRVVTLGSVSIENLDTFDPLIISHLQCLVSIASQHHLYPMRCLQRALVLQWLLARRGISSILRIGVRKEGAQFLAHAWLEHKGQPVGEPESVIGRYIALAATGCKQ